MTGWTNDDLLLGEQAQRIVAAASPRAFRVLEWPALGKEFRAHDQSANEAKKTINRHGAASAILGAIGASILAVDPLIPFDSFRSAVAVLGCAAVLAGGLMGLWHLRAHGGRARWLLNRMWTERLRQFHFQYLANHFDDAVAAMGNDDRLGIYRSRRDGALAAYVDDIGKQTFALGFIGVVRRLADDHEDVHAWAQGTLRASRVAAGTAMTRDHRELFDCLSRCRIGIQEIYAELNLKPGAASQKGLARRIALCANIATFVFVASLAVAGVLIVLEQGHAGFSADSLIALSGVAATWGLYFRLVDQGMGYALDAERYELYAEQVALVRQRFDGAGDDVQGKIDALRQLEIHAYREMRQFFRVHLRSRFLG